MPKPSQMILELRKRIYLLLHLCFHQSYPKIKKKMMVLLEEEEHPLLHLIRIKWQEGLESCRLFTIRDRNDCKDRDLRENKILTLRLKKCCWYWHATLLDLTLLPPHES